MALTKIQKIMVIEYRKDSIGFATIAKTIGVNRDQVRDYCRTKEAQRIAKEKGFDIKTIARNNVREVIYYECKYCGCSFVFGSSGYLSRMYCSKKCSQEAKNKRQRDNRESKLYICNTCGKQFVRKGSDTFCSNECRYPKTICNYCGKEFRSHANAIKKYCSEKCKKNKLTKSHEEYYEEFSKIHKGHIVPITKYVGNSYDLTVYCLECENKTTRKAEVFVSKDKRRGCNICNRQYSIGESLVKEWLDVNKLSYIRQYTVKGLSMNNLLRYDFALLNKENQVIALIEYDGRQHFEPVDTFGGDKELKRIKHSDLLKNNYAIDNGIELIRINYKDKYNVNEILKERLSNIQCPI